MIYYGQTQKELIMDNGVKVVQVRVKVVDYEQLEKIAEAKAKRTGESKNVSAVIRQAIRIYLASYGS